MNEAPYYYDKVLGQSQWDMPDCLKQLPSQGGPPPGKPDKPDAFSSRPKLGRSIDASSTLTSSSTSSPQPWPTCKTCGASNPTCEEDLEKPGTYYCARCWDVYEEEVRVIVGMCTATLF